MTFYDHLRQRDTAWQAGDAVIQQVKTPERKDDVVGIGNVIRWP
jgi:hypothetical protein